MLFLTNYGRIITVTDKLGTLGGIYMRCVHLDFHTSPAIEGIGSQFNKAEFTKTLKDAGVDLITVFAKCHHGYCYYPTKVGKIGRAHV